MNNETHSLLCGRLPRYSAICGRVKTLGGVDYEAVEVLSSIPNLKQWLRLRDRHAAFDDAKAQGYAGFPALLLDDDRVILDESKLKEIF